MADGRMEYILLNVTDRQFVQISSECLSVSFSIAEVASLHDMSRQNNTLSNNY